MTSFKDFFAGIFGPFFVSQNSLYLFQRITEQTAKNLQAIFYDGKKK